MGKPKLLDLFCCAGGAGRGYSDAGFEVYGVDIQPQKNYPFAFHQGDVLAVMAQLLAGEKVAFIHRDGQVEMLGLADFAAIHASPPCQRHSALHALPGVKAKGHVDLIPQTREALKAAGLPYIIENVIGAPVEGIMLCGTMFGLGTGDAELQRHRLFETSWFIWNHPVCQHGRPAVIGVYGGHLRDRRRVIGVYGKGCEQRGGLRHKHGRAKNFSIEQGREAMGIDWMTQAELSQAIPPAYTEFLGRLMLDHIHVQRAA